MEKKSWNDRKKVGQAKVAKGGNKLSQDDKIHGRIRKELSRAWAIAWKDIRAYYASPPTLMFGILFPFALFFTFTIGRNLSVEQMLPILFAQTVFWASSTVGPVVIPLERRMKTFDRYLSAPMSLMSVILGKSMAGFLYGLGVSVVPLIVGFTWFGFSLVAVIPFLLGILLSCVAFAAMGIMFASVPTESVGNIMMPMNFIRIPLLFISGIFIPITELPPIGQALSLLSPLTHTLILIRQGMGNETFLFPTEVSVLALILTSVVFLFISKQFHEINKKRE
ncbi:ABC transporter permease [Candidatus Thorarchaeota archaeon]|nr:MAG: ABC transporter permease [Candidatus Thorarchaeota archaeon]